MTVENVAGPVTVVQGPLTLVDPIKLAYGGQVSVFVPWFHKRRRPAG